MLRSTQRATTHIAHCSSKWIQKRANSTVYFVKVIARRRCYGILKWFRFGVRLLVDRLLDGPQRSKLGPVVHQILFDTQRIFFIDQKAKTNRAPRFIRSVLH